MTCRGPRRLNAAAFAASTWARRASPAPFADVEVLVAEQKPWRFELGVGYDTAVGLNGYLELSHDNLFGTARSAGIRITEAIGGEAIQRLDHVDLIYREPWIPGTPWQGQMQLYAELRENLGYDLQRVGLVAWIGDDLLNPRGREIFRSRPLPLEGRKFQREPDR
jgi:outer membrane protein assembly factor BamA